MNWLHKIWSKGALETFCVISGRVCGNAVQVEGWDGVEHTPETDFTSYHHDFEEGD